MLERSSIFRPRAVIEIVDGVPIFASDIEEAEKRATNKARVASELGRKYPKEYSGLEEQPLPSEQKDNLLRVNDAGRSRRGRKPKYELT